jgi:hypothetical protein
VHLLAKKLRALAYFLLLTLYPNIKAYIYIYVCVCVCVCARARARIDIYPYGCVNVYILYGIRFFWLINNNLLAESNNRTLMCPLMSSFLQCASVLFILSSTFLNKC